MKNIYITVRIIKIFAVLMGVFLAGYVAVFFLAGPNVSFIYMCAFFLLNLVFVVSQLRKFGSFRSEMQTLVFNITGVINSSFKLNNMLFHFFNNLLLKILNAFSKTFQPEELDHLRGVEQGFRKLQQEEPYFSREMTLDSPELSRFFTLDFKERVEQYTKEVNHFFDLLQESSQSLVADMEERADVYRRKNLFHRMVVEFSISSRIFSGLLDAIIINSSRTGESVSTQIVEMKQNIDVFLADIAKWQNEFLAKTSRVNFDMLMNRYKDQKVEFEDISSRIAENYDGLDLTLSNFVESVEKINENIQFIKEIADSINILSINASIEAARQGLTGRGFKVIAGEIKQLSNRTENFVNDIVTRIDDAGRMVSETSTKFKNNTGEILRTINSQREKNDVSYGMLKHYYENFNSMIEAMEKLTSEINKHIDKFYVILQDYDIEEQELNNLRRILDNCLEKYQASVKEINAGIPEETLKQIADKLLSDAEKIVTTRLEEETIFALFKDYGILKEKEKILEATDVELF